MYTDLYKESSRNLKRERIRWAIGVVIIIIAIIFIAFNQKLSIREYKTEKVHKKKQIVAQLKKDSVVKQKFKGHAGNLENIAIYFENQGKESSEGSIVLNVLDEEGKKIGTSEKKTTSIRTRKWIEFTIKELPEMDADKTYTLVLKCKDVYNSQGFGVYIAPSKNVYVNEEGKIDGKKMKKDHVTKVQFTYSYHSVMDLVRMFYVLGFGLVLIFIPYERIRKKTGKIYDYEMWITRAVFVAAPVIAFFIVEELAGFRNLEILIFLISKIRFFNIILYIVLLLLLHAIINRVKYSAIALWIISFIYGLANYYVYKFRGVPIIAADLLSTGTAMNVATEYDYSYDICVLWAVAIFASATGIMLGIWGHKGIRLKFRPIVIVAAILSLVLVNKVYINSQVLENNDIIYSQWKPQLTYFKNGSLLSFVTSWKYVQNDEPDGYSLDTVKEVAKKYKSDETDTKNATKNKMPNVIAIMNESLSDFDFDGKLETNKDYLPFIRGLEKNTIKGHLFVSIEGANTANSEYEFLTGNSMAMFPPRVVAYNTYVKDVVPSLTRTLKAQGYCGLNAYHPYKRSGWNRENVYRSFGFTHFYSEEHYEDPEYARNYITDSTDFKQLIKDYEAARKESDAPYYQFNVTVQNHGGYAGNRGFVDADVKVTTDGLEYDESNQFVTLAKMSDDAYKELIDYFSKVDEPTIIVTFGDHQPPLSNEFYSTLFGKDIDEFSTEQTANWYSTPYFIWANYDIKENKRLDMSANYLASYVLNLIGADLTGYNKYLLDLQKKVPVLTGLFYKGDDDKYREIDEESKYSKDIQNYLFMQYNGLMDQDNRVNDFFFLKGGDYEVKE